MNNKKLKIFIIAVLIVQMLLPAGLLTNEYSKRSEAFRYSPDFKFRLYYLDIWDLPDEEGEVLSFSIATKDLRTYYGDDIAVTADEKGYAKFSLAENKRLNKFWFSYKQYQNIGSYKASKGEFTYVDTEEAKKVMSEWKQRYFDHYGDDEIKFNGGNSVYITARIYKGIFIPTAVYKDGVKVIELAAK